MPVKTKTATTTKPKSKTRAAFKKEMRKKLLSEKDHLLTELSMKIRNESNSDKKEIGDIYDIASSERERELTLMLGDRDRERLQVVDLALERLENKDYGLCEECAEPIGQERIRALPFTTLCIECKSRAEKGTNVLGRFGKETVPGMLERHAGDDDDF